MTDLEVLGLAEWQFCISRDFFKSIGHPGANNCACPKLDNGKGCVPPKFRDAWFAYIGLSTARNNRQ